MEQYSLLKLNGEYVKLYVSTNPNLPRLVKNSGSLVVYHDLYSDININNELYKIYKPILLDTTNNVDEYLKIFNRSLENAQLYSDLTNTEFSSEGVVDNNGTQFNEDPYFTENNTILNGYELIKKSDILFNKSNYLYLGNELIAGGWGFLNKKQRDLAIKQLLYLPKWCQDLQTTIIQEQHSRKSQDYSLDTKFINYVKKGSNVGAPSNLIDDNINAQGYLYLSLTDFNAKQFHFDENLEEQINNWANAEPNSPEYSYKSSTQFLLKDLPKLFCNADYEDIEISNIDFVLKLMFYKLTKNSTGNYILEDNNKFNIENGTYTYYKIDRDDPNLIYVPIGSSLRYVNYNIKWITNESGGIKNLHTNSITKLSQTDGNIDIKYQNNNLGVSINGRDKDGNTINIENLVQEANGNSEEVNVDFKFNFDNYSNSSGLIKVLPFVYNQRIDILKDVYFEIAETPSSKYKKYPYLEDSFVSDILKSTQNIIQSHKYNLKPISIVPKYLIYFSELQPFKIDDTDLDKINIDFNLNREGNLKLSNYQLVLDNQISILLNFGTNDLRYKLFVFALPTIYNIDKIELKKGNNTKNITGIFKYISYINDFSLDPTNYNFEMTDKFNIYFGIFTYHVQTNVNPQEGEPVETITPIYNGEYELIISIKENNQKVIENTITPTNKYITLNGDSGNNILSLKEEKILNLFDFDVFDKYMKFVFNNDYESNHSISYNDNIFLQLLNKFNQSKDPEIISEVYHSKLREIYF